MVRITTAIARKHWRHVKKLALKSVKGCVSAATKKGLPLDSGAVQTFPRY